MKELATSEEKIATEIVTNDSTTDIETRNDDDTTENCYPWPSRISCVWLFISMLINGLILFAYPALSSYSYGEPIDDYKYEISYVFGFDKYWHHREYEDGTAEAPVDHYDLYTILCNEPVEDYNYQDGNSDDFCVLEKNGTLYFWLLITAFILQFIGTVINFKCGSCYFINNVCISPKKKYLLACVIWFISLWLPICGYLYWKSNSIEPIENITEDCRACLECVRRLMNEQENITFNNTYNVYNYNTSNVSSSLPVEHSTTDDWSYDYERYVPCDGSIKDRFANVAVLVLSCINTVMLLIMLLLLCFKKWCH